jgi:alanine-glyoxylate transaminase / serine-glyoxylate transaminase / serine-pyruvate transaminase
MNDRAFERRVARSQSWYLDLGMIAEYASSYSGARKYHHTAPVSMIFALHAGLGAVLDEGLEVGWGRHAECGARIQDGLDKLGFELLAAEGHRLPQLTTVRLPEAVDDAFARRALLDRFGIEVGGGVGPWAGTAWRVGCMGNTARLRNVAAFLSAVEEVVRW